MDLCVGLEVTNPCEKTILVVDDISANRDLLAGMLVTMGFRVLQAANGAEAVALFKEQRPWLVVMDVYMPVMDGIEATRQIKILAGNYFVPVLFVTGSQDELLVERCIDIGGDDFLHRPYSCAVLKSKLKSMQRFSSLYHELHGLHAVVQREKEVADGLLSGAIEGGNVALSQVLIHKQPASIFCGDIHLTAFRPNGDINVLLGDFTGHGITSIIGSLPVSETFRAMTRKGFSGNDILYQLNRKLFHLLPKDMFLAAVLVTVSREEGVAYIWNCGMPEVYVYGQRQTEYKYCVSSSEPPLGIIEELDSVDGDLLPVEADDRILLISDGVADARNFNGEFFGRQRIEAALAAGNYEGQPSAQVIKSLTDFIGHCDQDDDLSIIELPCNIEAPRCTLLTGRKPQQFSGLSDESLWCWSLELRGVSLRQVNPIPMTLSQLQEVQNTCDGWQPVFTILTELYVNALDHGVLEMDSSLKSSSHGFARYFSEREIKLDALTEGFVRIALKYQPFSESEGLLSINVQDSGSGFDFQHWLDKAAQPEAENIVPGLSGRGLRLVSDLAEDIRYSQNGTVVDVSYLWKKAD